MSIGSIILPDASPDDWPGLRARIHRRIWGSLGQAPDGAVDRPAARFEVVERYRNLDLDHVRIRYHVLGEEWGEGVLVLPEGGRPAPAVLCVHGTNALGKESLLDPDLHQGRRAFPIELARRGVAAFAVDQYGFGSYVPKECAQAPFAEWMRESTERFYSQYPEWSLDGRRLLDMVRALDVLDALESVEHGAGYGAIGNSLGGRGVIFLAALDERVAACACSTGISTHAANVHRLILGNPLLSRQAIEGMKRTGRLPWEYHEMIALCAPRALLLIEPFNDAPGCNPDVLPNLECFYRASEVYRLLGMPERLALHVHGDGHDLVDDVREMAYRWMERFLCTGA